MGSIELLTVLPAFTSIEELHEHQSSTPSTFNRPPTLRRKQDKLRVQLNPSIAGFSELSEGVMGDLYISEGSLVFFSTALSKGVLMPYPAIALHAISRQPMRPWQPASGSDGAQEAPLADIGLAGGPCIYCQIDEAATEQAEDAEDDEHHGQLRDLVLTPDDASTIEPIFEALSYCASLFPSTMSDDEGPAFADADVNGHAENGDIHVDDSEVGRAARDYIDGLVDWSTLQPAAIAHSANTADEHAEAFADAVEESA